MKIVLSFVFFAIILSCFAAFADAIESSGGERIDALSKNWGTENARFEKTTEPTSSKTGPCFYDEDSDSVKYTDGALAMADAELASCLARAVAESRYANAEEQWKKFLGVREAYVVRAGKVQLIETPKGNALPSASTVRGLWASFATSELVRAAEHGAAMADAGLAARDTEDVGREIASDGSSDTGAVVRNLLGI